MHVDAWRQSTGRVDDDVKVCFKNALAAAAAAAAAQNIHIDFPVPSMTGVFRDDAKTREEFLTLIARR